MPCTSLEHTPLYNHTLGPALLFHPVLFLLRLPPSLLTSYSLLPASYTETILFPPVRPWFSGQTLTFRLLGLSLKTPDFNFWGWGRVIMNSGLSQSKGLEDGKP